MSFSTAILAYLGPETMLPMTSVVAGLAGVVMLFGRRSIAWASGAVRRLARVKGEVLPGTRPKTRRIGNGPVGRIAPAIRVRQRS